MSLSVDDYHNNIERILPFSNIQWPELRGPDAEIMSMKRSSDSRHRNHSRNCLPRQAKVRMLCLWWLAKNIFITPSSPTATSPLAGLAIYGRYCKGASLELRPNPRDECMPSILITFAKGHCNAKIPLWYHCIGRGVVSLPMNKSQK